MHTSGQGYIKQLYVKDERGEKRDKLVCFPVTSDKKIEGELAVLILSCAN